MVIELHSDFLSYLTFSKKHTPYDEESRSSLSQLKEGHVSVLATTIYTSTLRSLPSLESEQQMTKYHELVTDPTLGFISPLETGGEKGSVMLIPCIENCSGFAEEEEPLEQAFQRFQRYFTKIPPLYVSLTWHEENRFGGGNMTKVGLKPDGRSLLDFLEGKVGAIDLSHTSDFLAHDMLNYIEKKGLQHRIIASHSNFREVMSVPRNLPLDIASYIAEKEGVIGLNLLDAFVGQTVQDLLKHIDYAVQHGLEKNLAFGGDFFSPKATLTDPHPRTSYHFPEASTVACYPFLLNMIGERFSKEITDGIAEKNADRLLLSAYREMVSKLLPA